jgi:hypothetical protein
MIMRVVTKIIRELWNIKTVIYLNDVILFHQDRNYLKNVGTEIEQFLKFDGMDSEVKKSYLNSSKT